MTNSSNSLEIIFADAGLADLDHLLAGLPPNARVHLLDPTKDGLQQMVAALGDEQNISAVHILTHGSQGTLQLGNLRLDSGNLASHSQSLATIGQALAPDADLLLYGCNVAAGTDGASFVTQLAQLTGADVAASTDLTGAALRNGDWDLEFRTGDIEGSVCAVTDYDHSLATTVVATTTPTPSWTLNNGLLRFGNGAESSLNSAGNLLQPFYYGSVRGTTGFYKLTYANYPLNSAIGVGGTGTATWNTNGTIVYDQALTGWTVNDDGFVRTSGDIGYGTLISYGNLAIGDFELKISNRYELGQNASFVKVTTTVTNIDSTPLTTDDRETITNLRFWVGTQDDWVGDTDRPTKTRGNITDGVFSAISSSSDQSRALQITSGDTGVVFYSLDNVYTYIRNGYTSFSNVVAQDPSTSSTTTSGDDSYAMYVRMPDIAYDQSASFTWYYAAGAVSDLSSIVSSLGAKLQYSINTLTESSSNNGAVTTIVGITLTGDTFTGANSDDFTTGAGSAKASVTNVPAGLTAAVIRTGATTAELRLTGNATAHANANDISNLQITFQNASFTGADAASVSGRTKTFNIDFIQGSNTAPTGLGDLTLVAVDEDSVSPSGGVINALTGLNFTDSDTSDTLSGIAVVGNGASSSTQGSWQYSTNSTNWFDIGTVSASQALSLSAGTKVRFVPVANYNGTPSGLTVRALDSSANFFSTTGTTETRVTLDASNNGGSSGVSGNTNTIATSINPVNDAPTVSSSGSTSYTENAAATAINSSLTLADVDNTTLASATVSITANFQSGADVLAFTNNGTSMGNIAASYDAATGALTLASADASATVAEWQAALRAVTYANTSDAPTTSTRTVSFVVNDGAASSSAGTRSVSVTAANDIPTIQNLNADVASGTTKTQ